MPDEIRTRTDELAQGAQSRVAEQTGFPSMPSVPLPSPKEGGPSSTDKKRLEGALKKYGLPLALSGLAWAIGSREGAGPEAGAGMLFGQIQGMMQASVAARNAQAQAEQARTEQLIEISKNPNIDPSSLGGVFGELGNRLGGVGDLQPRDREKESVRKVGLQLAYKGLYDKNPKARQRAIELAIFHDPDNEQAYRKIGAIIASDGEEGGLNAEALRIILKAGDLPGMIDALADVEDALPPEVLAQMLKELVVQRGVTDRALAMEKGRMKRYKEPDLVVYSKIYESIEKNGTDSLTAFEKGNWEYLNKVDARMFRSKMMAFVEDKIEDLQSTFGNKMPGESPEDVELRNLLKEDGGYAKVSAILQQRFASMFGRSDLMPGGSGEPGTPIIEAVLKAFE